MMTLTGKPAMVNRPQLERELHDLQERLADAWWHEQPLSDIQRLEERIAECHRMLARKTEAAHRS